MAERLRCARSCPGTHDRDRYWVTIRCRGAEPDFPHAFVLEQVLLDGPVKPGGCSWLNRGSHLGSAPHSGADHDCGWSQRLSLTVGLGGGRRLSARMRSARTGRW